MLTIQLTALSGYLSNSRLSEAQRIKNHNDSSMKYRRCMQHYCSTTKTQKRAASKRMLETAVSPPLMHPDVPVCATCPRSLLRRRQSAPSYDVVMTTLVLQHAASSTTTTTVTTWQQLRWRASLHDIWHVQMMATLVMVDNRRLMTTQYRTDFGKNWLHWKITVDSVLSREPRCGISGCSSNVTINCTMIFDESQRYSQDRPLYNRPYKNLLFRQKFVIILVILSFYSTILQHHITAPYYSTIFLSSA
jgi:hypothetical protein